MNGLSSKVWLIGCLQEVEIEILYSQLEEDFGAVTFEAWLALMVSCLERLSCATSDLRLMVGC